jgi:tripartite-type tricarboxylate transporter receptor subunit TctC
MIFARALTAPFLAAFILATGAASAQTYPSRPVTLVVPYPPGGATDAISRIIQDGMSQSLGQQLIIENISGAARMIAAARLPAAPDGYTILIHQVALAAGMTMQEPTFDAEKISSPSASSTRPLRRGRRVGPAPNNMASWCAG